MPRSRVRVRPFPAGTSRSVPAPRDSVIQTLKVKLVFGLYAKGPWEATMEIASSATLVDPHLAIEGAVQISDDHMYMFHVARTPGSHDRIDFDNEDGSLEETTLTKIFPLANGRKLF